MTVGYIRSFRALRLLVTRIPARTPARRATGASSSSA